jgi:methylmalonyl-CoA mutase
MSKDQNQNKEPQCANVDVGLFAEFSGVTYKQWRDAAEQTLKGAPFEKKLVTKTYEGIDLQPIYWQEDIETLSHTASFPGKIPYLRHRDILGYLLEPWRVSQELVDATPALLNQAARNDLERGQTELNVLLDQAALAGMDADAAKTQQVGKGGVSISSSEDMAKMLEDIAIDKAPIYLQAGAVALPALALLISVTKDRKIPLDKLSGCVGMDPLAVLADKGALPYSLQGAYDMMAALPLWAKKNVPALQTIVVQTHPYHNGGGNSVQELAYAMATAVEYVSEMLSRGISIDEITPRIRFSFSVGSKFFMEVAKLRAARLLWTQIVQAFGGQEEAQKMHMHVCTSLWTKTVYDPYVNMLRTTTEAFSGIMGGANSIHVGAFDQVIRPPDEFSRRIARNIQIILEKESKLGVPIDQSGGSWYIEKLTDEVAKKAWSVFQELEAKGGMSKALKEGIPQAQIAKVAAERKTNIGHRRDIFVGTNMYPNLGETPLPPRAVDHEAVQEEQSEQLARFRALRDEKKLKAALGMLAAAKKTAGEELVAAAIAAAQAGATLGDIAEKLRDDAVTPKIQAIPCERGAEIFEALRKAAEQYQTKTGSRPKVFLANMGPIPQHKARADFSTGFFETGGFEVIKNDGFPTVEDAAKAALESKASLVVICSTDDTYPELVPPLAKRIKEASPNVTIILAGYPVDHVDAFKQAGVDDFIHMRANCYEMLRKLQEKKGVAYNGK